MSAPQAPTKPVNLRIEQEHEQLLRDVGERIRTGGPGFRAALRALIEDDSASGYVTMQEFRARLAEIERQLPGGSSTEAFETRLEALEARLRDVEEMALSRITRFGADSCGG